jgi:hypothetical protein
LGLRACRTSILSLYKISAKHRPFFKGGVNIRWTGASYMPIQKKEKHVVAVDGSPLADIYDERAEEEISQGNYRTLDDDSDLEALIPRGRSEGES